MFLGWLQLGTKLLKSASSCEYFAGVREAKRGGSGCATRAKASVCNASALRANEQWSCPSALGRASDCKTLGPKMDSNALGCPKMDSKQHCLLSILGQSRA